MGAYGPPPGFYRNSPRVRIDARYCTGCLRCVEVCPQDEVLRAIKSNGKVLAVVKNSSQCVGCRRCVSECLTNAIGTYLI